MKGLDFSDISKLNERYARDPTSRIFVQLADAYRKNNMVDEALDVLNKGIEYHPQYALAYLVIGKCYYEKRAHIQAKDAFEKTIALDPQNVVALRMLAKTYEMLKDEKGQINAYKNIIAIDPQDTQAKDRLSMLEALQRKEPLYTLAMAEEYEKQGNLEESLKIYENLLYTDPGDPILRQKTAELKKAVEDRKRKVTEEGVIDLQLERMFRPEELTGGPPAGDAQTPTQPVDKPTQPATEAGQAADKPGQAADKPGQEADKPGQEADKPAQPADKPGQEADRTARDSGQPARGRTSGPMAAKLAAAAEEGIQRLEDFLAEELEHAANRGQTPPSTAAPDNQPIALPDDHTAPEDTPSPAAAMPPETIRHEETTSPPARELLYQEIDWEETLASEPKERIDKPGHEADKPVQTADQPAQTVDKTTEEIVDRPAPVAERPAEAEPIRPAPGPEPLTTPSEPAAGQTAAPTPAGEAPETGDDKEAGAGTKKPPEDDFKSFQDWLSGLLK